MGKRSNELLDDIRRLEDELEDAFRAQQEHVL